MLSIAVWPGKLLRLLLCVSSASVFVLAGCSTVFSTISDGGSQSTTPPVTSAPTLPVTTAPVPPPTPALPTTLSPELNASSVFIGASIIRRWPLPMHNAGVPGQTSSEVLQRFPADALHQGYGRVIIQVGSNDILERVKDPPSTVAANISAMAQEAGADHTAVYVISLGPITVAGRNLDASAMAVNAALREAADIQGFAFVDIFSSLQGHPEYFVDGLHPNAAGYAIVERLLAQAIAREQASRHS